MSDWQPIDTAPCNEWVLLRGGRSDSFYEHDYEVPHNQPAVVAIRRTKEDWDFWCYGTADADCIALTYEGPTEWMPIPA